MLFNTLTSDTVSAKKMIDILNCDVKQFSYLDDMELDSLVEFNSEFGTEYVCTLRELQYTYKFCKRLLEMCYDAGFIK